MNLIRSRARFRTLAGLVAGAVAIAAVPAAARAAASNIEITSSGTNNAEMLYDYSQAGKLLKSVAVPTPPDGYDQLHDLTVDRAGNVQLVYGSGPYLATYNGSAWAFHTALNYGLYGTTYNGAIATYNQYVYVQSDATPNGANGIIRFDTSNNYTYTLTQYSDAQGTDYEPQDVTTGMNGGLYVNYYIGGAGGHRVVEYNPVTMAVLSTVNLPYGNGDGYHTVADAQGDLYVLGYGYLNKYSPTGTFIKDVTLSGDGDLAISNDGDLLTTQNAIAYVFDSNLNMLDSTPVQAAYWGEPFVTFDTYQAPVGSVVPEPTGAGIAAAGAAAGCWSRRRRRSPRGREPRAATP